MRYFDYSVNTNPATERFLPSTEDRASVSFLFDHQGHRKYLTTSERRAFLNTARRLTSNARTFCRTLAYTGCRISEALNLTPARIDFTARIVIFESLKKRRRGVFRAVPIPLTLLTELDRVHHIRDARLDPVLSQQRLWPWCRTTAWNYVKRSMKAAGISGPQGSPKGLRHSFAVAALQAGVPINLVKKWLGHSRLSTTEIYADAVGQEEQFIAAKFWRKF